ncbi:sorbin and SH3 domain-containing protein 1-like [Pseudophryne corroboree]|uniref:sorbin and SH3 domain-containing protein 1-like n=1 Tax=Pseudophryne corroboree TaxID=495146 RepID=UPI003081CD3F
MDSPGGNAHVFTHSSVNKRICNSNSLGSVYKQKSSLSVAKTCIAEILPSRFKPIVAVQAPCMYKQSASLPQQKAQSCENLLEPLASLENKQAGGCVENMLAKSCKDYKVKSGSAMSLQEYSLNSAKCSFQSNFRSGGPEFNVMYRDMHHINRSTLCSSSSCSNVRDIASQFEREGKNGACHKFGLESSKNVPKHTVSSRVTAFEQLIQRSRSLPSLDISSEQSFSPTPPKSRAGIQSASSAESLLEIPIKRNTDEDVQPLLHTIADPKGNVEERTSDLSDNTLTDGLSGCTDETDLLSNASSDSCNSTAKPPQKSKTNTCKSSCPASYTRFTTIRRHEQKMAKNSHLKSDTQADRLIFQRNIYLISPLPFRLKKPLQNSPKKTCDTTEKNGDVIEPSRESQPDHKTKPSEDVEEKPHLPMRQSSFEIVERLSCLNINNFEHDNTNLEEHCSDSLNNGDIVSFPLCYNLDSNNNSQLSEGGAVTGGGVFLHLANM